MSRQRLAESQAIFYDLDGSGRFTLMKGPGGPEITGLWRTMRSLVLSFLVLIALSAAFLAVGLLIAFWPATYLRWVRWSSVENYAPWLLRGWDVNHGHSGWRVRIVGVGMALFGVTAAILTVWIHWFQ